MIPMGTRIDNYRVAEWLGDGGMGDVYRATDVMLERDVALKFLRPELARTPDVVERFRAEAVLVARLQHPYIAAVHGLHRHGDELMMVMEFVPGETLEQLLRREGRVPTARALDIARQIARALDYAHGLGIVHRDIKPANVMIDHHGRVKVLDFGIAKVLGADCRTRAGSMLGTLGYMAPERIEGREADGRSDIYSLGAVMFELLTGRTLFTADTEWALMQAHLHQPPESLRTHVAIAPSLDRLVLEMLAKAPRERPRTAAAVERRLAQISAASSTPRHGRTASRPSPTASASDRVASVVTSAWRALAARPGWRPYAVATGAAGLVVAALSTSPAFIHAFGTPAAPTPGGAMSKADGYIGASLPPAQAHDVLDRVATEEDSRGTVDPPPAEWPATEPDASPEGGHSKVRTTRADGTPRQVARQDRIATPQEPPPPMTASEPPALDTHTVTPPAPEADMTAPRDVVLPQGTSIVVTLVTPLDTKSAFVEDRVEARVRDAVVVGGDTVIPAGAGMLGTVRQVKKPGRIKGRASLTLVFETLTAGGASYSLEVAPLVVQAGRNGARDAAAAGAGGVAGGVIGGALGGRDGSAVGAGLGALVGVFRRGEDLELDAGQALDIRLRGALTVQLPGSRP